MAIDYFAKDKTFSNAYNAIDIIGDEDRLDTFWAENVTFDNVRIAMRLKRFRRVVVINCTTSHGSQIDGEQFAYGLALGAGFEGSGVDQTFVDRLTVGNLGDPSNDYGNFNRDSIVAEDLNGLMLIKDSVLSGTTDGGIDTKSPYKMIRTTVGPSYLQLRTWNGVAVETGKVGLDANPDTSQLNRQMQFPGTGGDSIRLYYGGEPFFDNPNFVYDTLPTQPVVML